LQGRADRNAVATAVRASPIGAFARHFPPRLGCRTIAMHAPCSAMQDQTALAVLANASHNPPDHGIAAVARQLAPMNCSAQHDDAAPALPFPPPRDTVRRYGALLPFRCDAMRTHARLRLARLPLRRSAIRCCARLPVLCPSML